MIYIDGDHTLEGVRRDAFAAIDKLNDDGILIFNDYIMCDYTQNIPYGVMHVVNDLCVNHGWKINGFTLLNHMFCDVSLERREVINKK